MLKKVTKRFFKIILWIIGIFIALDLLIVTLITIPPIQQFAVLKVSKILTHITGGEITVDKIYLSPTLTLTAKNFAIKDHHFNNMIFATTLKGKINLSKTKNGQVCLSFAQLDEGEVVLRKYADEENVNIAIWAKGFKKNKEKKSKFKLLFENIKLNEVRFVFINDDKRLYKEDNTIDYAFFELQHIVLDVDNFLVFGPDISCQIKSLTLSQHTGFEISSFSGNFRIYSQGLSLDSLQFTTPNSSFKGDFAFKYNDFPDYADFVNLINFDTQVKSATLDMKDVIYFAPALEGMNNYLVFSGYVGGTVNHLQTKDIYLKYKTQTHFAGDLSIANVLDFKKSSFNISCKDVFVNFDELAQFNLPKGKQIKLPKAIESLTYSNIRGNFKGSWNQFDTDLSIQTNLGKLVAEMKTISQNSHFLYSGTITGHNLELGKLLNQTDYFTQINLSTSFEGEADKTDLLHSLSVKMKGAINEIDVCGYPFQHLDFHGNYAQKKVNVALHSPDSLASFFLKGSANFAKDLPIIDATLTKVNIKLSELCSYFPYSLDSASAKGFDKLILKAQQTPDVVFSMDSIIINMSGNNLDNINGFVGIDNAKMTNGVKTSRIDWFRLTAINKPDFLHHYQIHSNAINVTYKTNYNFKDAISAIANAADFYIPEMFGFSSASEKIITNDNDSPFIDIDLQFFYTNNLFQLLLPQLSITRNSSAQVYLGKTRDEDEFNLVFPLLNYAEVGRVNNLNVKGKMNKDEFFEILLQCDSATIYQKKGGTLTFSNIDAQTRSNKETIQFNTKWYNPKMISIHEQNHLNGLFFVDTNQNMAIKVTDSKFFVRESKWTFLGEDNIISFGKHNNLIFNNCVLSSFIGKISVNGEISKQLNKECNFLLDNFDISLLNTMTAKMGMNFDGNMALMGSVIGKENHFEIRGRSLVKDFVFNQEQLGDLFVAALLSENGDPLFAGGILSNTNKPAINISKFVYTDYLTLPNRIIELRGRWNAQTKSLRIHADMDTLKLGFLAPFLSSFSDMVTGNASGSLDFVMKPDSLYFDGTVKIKNAQLGIEPLHTVYTIVDQEIMFNPKGIIFNDVKIKDIFNNEATLSGYVHHNKFKDFMIDLNMATKRIMALNTQRKMDASFFGDGFVSGDISIKGDTKQLNFSSQNIKTLSGSTITFPITSASAVSSSQGIYFIKSNENKELIIEKNRKSSTIMDFDFVFDITKDADVKLELEPIDGILKCKTSGKLHLLYNTNTDEMNLDGILAIVSGKFHMSLKNFFPRDFTIVEGGTISFSGPLTSAQLNVSALYQKSASLNSLSSDLKIGRTEVNAYLGLTGNLMNPNPSFSFAFPRLNNSEQTSVFGILDTANQQNGIRQFFSFVFLNTFITTENINAPSMGIGTGGDLVAGILNSFLAGQSNKVNIGVNYINNQDENSNYQEYSMDASVNLYNDKLWLKTSLGLGYDNSSEAKNNNFVGDVGFEAIINDNWKFNIFYFNDTNQGVLRVGQGPQQGGGVGLKFRQDFNNRKDFMESWKIKKKDKKK